MSHFVDPSTSRHLVDGRGKSAKPRLALAVLFLVATLSASAADARPGSGGSFGTRGSRSFSVPRATPTAPNGAVPFNRGPSQAVPSPSAPVQPGFAQARPGSRFGGGFMGGLLGAGLFGLLLGAGFSGGLGGIGSFIGLILQLLLVVVVVRLMLGWFRGRQQQSAAGPAARGYGSGAVPPGMGRPSPGPAAMQGGGAGVQDTPIRIEPADYDAFERLLGTVQQAYGAEDVRTLRTVVTPQMASEFERELLENNQRGVVNRISDVKLLQGDLAEAWAEPGAQFATVAMRYALTDVLLDRATGRPAPGGQTLPQQATEIWTFVRPANDARPENWRLSAIQQAA